MYQETSIESAEQSEKEPEKPRHEKSKKKKRKSQSPNHDRKESKRRKSLECKQCAKAAAARTSDSIVNRCKLTPAHLAIDQLRVLMAIGGLFYAGKLSAVQAPDVYAITLDGERGNRPHIHSREEILKDAVIGLRLDLTLGANSFNRHRLTVTRCLITKIRLRSKRNKHQVQIQIQI